MNTIKYRKRLVFSKEGRLRFVGHLDLLRVFHRALNRAGIELVFSQGFNPHPQISFSQPLSLGSCGKHEYMELRLTREWDDTELLNRLNPHLPEGLHVSKCRTLPEDAKPVMSLATHALYEISLPEKYTSEYASWLQDFLSQDEILIKKLAKYHGEKQEVTVDIKPLIESLELISPCVLQLWCFCDNPKYLKPDRMMQAFWQHCGHPEAIRSEQICRQDLFREQEGIRRRLMDIIV